MVAFLHVEDNMKVSDYVIKFLESKNIEHVFTISGGGCMHLIDSLGSSEKISYVCNHHEQATAMALEGYARINEHIGVGIVTTGPGGTNTLTGVMGAWLDSIPMLIISGQVQTTQLSDGTGCRQVGDQEFDIVNTMKDVTKYAVRVDDKEDIRYALEKAYVSAITGRPGPSWVDIPLDIQAQEINPEQLKSYTNCYIAPSPTHEEISRFMEKLKNSQKPLMILGGGIRLSPGAKESLDKFLKKYNIPAATGAHSAVDVVNESYPYYCGRIGVLGHRSSNHIVQEADFVFAVGSRLNIKMTGYKYDAFAKNAYKAMIDIDKYEMNKFNITADLKIHSDANEFLKALIKDERLKNVALSIDSWRNRCRQLRSEEIYVHPKRRNVQAFASNYCFVEALSELIPEEVPTVTSNGSAHVITLKVMKLKGKQRLFTNVGCASMGYGLPAAIGACFANNKRKTICIEGDGSLQMNIQELQTVVHHNLPLVIFVINNGQYLSIKLTQENYFNSRYVGTNIESGVSCPDLRKISDAYGIKYLTIAKNDDISNVIEKCMIHRGPVLCEVFTDPSEKHEPKVSAILNQDGTFSPGELTDMKFEGE